MRQHSKEAQREHALLDKFKEERAEHVEQASRRLQQAMGVTPGTRMTSGDLEYLNQNQPPVNETKDKTPESRAAAQPPQVKLETPEQRAKSESPDEGVFHFSPEPSPEASGKADNKSQASKAKDKAPGDRTAVNLPQAKSEIPEDGVFAMSL